MEASAEAHRANGEYSMLSPLLQQHSATISSPSSSAVATATTTSSSSGTEVVAMSRNQQAVDVLALAIESVVDRKFRSLDAAIANLERITLALASKNEKAGDPASEKVKENKEEKKVEKKEEKVKDDKGEKTKDGKEGKDSKEGKDAKEGKDSKEGKDAKEGKDGKEGKESKEGKGDKKKKEKVPFREVGIAYKVNCVSDISEVSCTFVIDMKAFFSWKDEKLIGRKNGANINYEEEKGLFDPDIVVSNEHDLKLESSVTKLTDPDTGEVKRTNSYKGTVFLLSMNLKSFPFDCQNLQICFKPYKLPIESVKLVPKPATESAMDHPVIHEWNVKGICGCLVNSDL
jgi:chromatin remodeling complex protein RSC6